MTPALQDLLYVTWPKIFVQKDWGPIASGMSWGCQCGDGWAPLIDALCEVVSAHARSGAHRILAATTVKEKCGSLRMHFEARCKYCDGARWMAEAYSTRICELTGQPGIRHVALDGVKALSSRVGDCLGFQSDREVRSHGHFGGGVPPGWRGIVDAANALLEERHCHPVLSFSESNGHLKVLLNQQPTQFEQGVAACAVALSLRTDRDKGKVDLHQERERPTIRQ